MSFHLERFSEQIMAPFIGIQLAVALDFTRVVVLHQQKC